MTGENNQPVGVFDLSGTTLGKYRLVEKVGQGGMAQVYRAYQPDLDRYVAVKVLHPHLLGDDDFVARFQREARAVATLEHPYIVRVYDFDAAGGVAFLVMENLGGRSLKTLLRDLDCQGVLMDLQEAVRIVGALADALDHAHRQGLVHRDVKPSNVILTDDDRPVLTDFGIARMLEGSTAITESGGTLGTPAYMSPEQCKGETGDARSDIYALGVLLYQLCTGRVPFDADTPYAVILKHISSPLPSPRSLRPDLPEAVERVILKAMAKEPDNRYQTAGEMGCALHEALHKAAQADEMDSGEARARRNPLKGPVDGLRSPSGRAILRVTGIVVAVCIVGGALLLAPRLSWVAGYLGMLTPSPTPTAVPTATSNPTTTPEPAPGPTVLEIAGPRVVEDTWINPDVPDDVFHDFDLVHLQGPLTPDRILLRFDLADLPEGAEVISATLALKVELWGEEVFPGVAVAYRVLTAWEAAEATYNKPWSAPGLAAGIDYDQIPLDIVPMSDEGGLILDVTRALEFWHGRGEPNYGVVIMMSEDSHNWAHHWVYLSEQPAPADRPALRITYEEAP
ncbi:MAG: protein kinase [Anaerolineae bacterium]|nr:protein kinase [Anaerolineae bacterium]